MKTGPAHDRDPLRPVARRFGFTRVSGGTVSKPLLLDAFCKAGGAGAGYARAGFRVVGVDIEYQPNYPFDFIRGDAVKFIKACGKRFDAIHASPPCQAYSATWQIQMNDHPELIEPTRDAIADIGCPYVIENVEGAPLRDPVVLCGAMFDIRTYRHRLFEFGGFEMTAPEHPDHVWRQAKMGRPPAEDEFMHVVGNFSNVSLGREIMGMPWASRNELSEAIPVAYSEYVGRHLITALGGN